MTTKWWLRTISIFTTLLISLASALAAVCFLRSGNYLTAGVWLCAALLASIEATITS